MSTEETHSTQTSAEPVHADVSFEERDVKAGTIYRYLMALALAVIAAYGICVYVLRETVHVATQEDTPPPPIRGEIGSNSQEVPPEPRLQGIPSHSTDPQFDRRLKLEADRDALEKAGWLDQNGGVAQIPIEDAMKIIAEKGLPGASPAPAGKNK